MGYDCTFHVIDPGAVRKFDRWFSGAGAADAMYEQRYRGTAWRNETLVALAAGKDMRREVLQGLLLWCSMAAPHTTSRGFALSLWERGGLNVELPSELRAWSLDDQLPKTLAAYPALKGLHPAGFSGNWDVGLFISADKVAAARAFVAGVLDREPGRHNLLEPLLDVLMVAEHKGMAFWEATDLPVSQAKTAWLEAVRPAAEVAIERITLSGTGMGPHLIGVGEDWLMMGEGYYKPYVLVVDRPGRDATVRRFEGEYILPFDGVSVGPRAVAAALYRDKESRLCVFDVDKGPTEIRFDRAAAGFGPTSGLVLAPLGPDTWLVAAKGYPVGQTPVILRGGVIEPSGLPPAERRSLRMGSFGWRDLGQGVGLLEWDTQGYLWRDGAFKHLGDIELEGTPADGWAVEEGRLVLDNRVLTRVDREGHRTPVAADVPNTMHASQGPAGAWLLAQGNNKQGDLFKVIWPTGEVTRGSRAKFGRIDPRWTVSVDGVIWAQEASVAHRIRWNQVSRLKRSNRG